MSKVTEVLAVLAIAIVVAIGLTAAEARSEELPGAGEMTAEDKAFQELLVKEKAARKDCKIKVCSLFRSKKTAGDDVGCHIDKSLSADDMSKLIKKAMVSWPWGNVSCGADVKLKRADIVGAMTEAKKEIELDEHLVVCKIAREEAGEFYEIKLKLKPKLTFEAGKATEATVGWGDGEAPGAVQSVLWPATGLDNQLNMLGGKVVEVVNEFTTTKCDEVKAELIAD